MMTPCPGLGFGGIQGATIVKRQLVGAGLGATIVILAAAAASQSLEDLVDQLAHQVAALDNRLSRLEHASGGSPSGPASGGGPGMSSPSGAVVVRTMVVDGITTAANSDDNSAQINQLNQSIGSLQDTVNTQQDQLSTMSGQQIQSTQSGEAVSTNRGNVDRQIDSQRDLVGRYQTQLMVQREQVQRLQDADTQPKQVINGHEGSIIITLDSKFDISRDLSAINVGDTVTWTGTRISSGNGSETWRIDTIKKVN